MIATKKQIVKVIQKRFSFHSQPPDSSVGNLTYQLDYIAYIVATIIGWPAC